MELILTDIRIFPVSQPSNPRLKAFVTIVLNDCFLIRDVKIIEGKEGLFLSMPAKKMKDGQYKDIVHPLNNATRQSFQDKIFEAFKNHKE